MDFEMTLDDPNVFTKPITVKRERLLAPDTDLLKDVCENEKDAGHLTGGIGLRLSRAVANAIQVDRQSDRLRVRHRCSGTGLRT